MNTRAAVLLVLAGAAMVSATVAAKAFAGACAGGPVTERWQLELVSVTIDAKEQVDHAAYDPLTLFLSSLPGDGVRLTIRHADDPRIAGIGFVPRAGAADGGQGDAR